MKVDSADEANLQDGKDITLYKKSPQGRLIGCDPYVQEDYTQRRLEAEISKLVIDLVWSATDGGCKLKESDFSHFEEPLHEWTELVNKFSTSIAQAEQEMLERVVGEDRRDVQGGITIQDPEAFENKYRKA